MTWIHIVLRVSLLVVVGSALARLEAQTLSQSGISVLRPSELSKPKTGQLVRQTHESRGNVRRRAEYGKPFQYGRTVSGPYGDITIWSPATDNSYGKPPPPRFGPRQPMVTVPRGRSQSVKNAKE